MYFTSHNRGGADYVLNMVANAPVGTGTIPAAVVIVLF